MSAPGNTDPRPLVIELRQMAADDLPFVRATWRETHKMSPVVERWTYGKYKASAMPLIERLLASDDTRLLGAYVPDGRIAGWLAYTPGRSVSTIHWVLTRVDLDGDKLRRRGVMAALIDHADLGKRWAYTHRGPYPHRNGSKRRGSGVPMDEQLAEWAQRTRGVQASYLPIEDWLRA